MYLASVLDLTATIPVLAAVLFLYRQRGSSVGLARNNLLRLCIYYVVLVFAYASRGIAQDPLPFYGIVLSLGLVILSFGHVTAVINYCPDVKRLRDSILRLVKPTLPNVAYLGFSLVGLGWMVVSIFNPASTATSGPSGDVIFNLSTNYLMFTTIVMVVLIGYPSLLLVLAINRAKTAGVRESLVALLAGWVVLPASQLFILFSQASPSTGYPTEVGLLASSTFFVLCTFSVRSSSGIIRVLTSQLTPQPVLKTGQRYLILHDGGKEIVSFLSASFQSIIEAGGRVVLNLTSPAGGGLVEGLSRGQPKFENWLKTGKIVKSTELENSKTRAETLAERFSQGPTQLAYVTPLETDDLKRGFLPESDETREKNQPVSQLYLLESRKAPRPLLTEFLNRNGEVEVLNLSEAKDTFSGLVNTDHQHVQGSKILLEFDSNTNYEEIVERFFTEGASNAELCALFTTKSSKLYRTMKGNKMVKMISASSLVSSMDELPDGETQIPDHELGLVASVTSNILENNPATNTSIVFDSLQELITGDHWEQTYSGIKQLFELVSVPHSTVIFLGNRATMDPKLLGAIRGFFGVQLRLDSAGLHVQKMNRL